jgi:hypothetical protein
MSGGILTAGNGGKRRIGTNNMFAVIAFEGIRALEAE